MSLKLNTRWFGAQRGRDSWILQGTYEAVASRYHWCRGKTNLAAWHAFTLGILMVLLVMLGQRTVQLKGAPGSADGMLTGLLAAIVVLMVGAGWLLWRTMRRWLMLRRELRDLECRAEQAE